MSMLRAIDIDCFPVHQPAGGQTFKLGHGTARVVATRLGEHCQMRYLHDRGSCMTDVFISYAREDRSQAAELAQLLEEAGYTVWWDWRLVGGSQYREIIDAKLTEARKVIVLWSVRSVGSAFVIDEAQEA